MPKDGNTFKFKTFDELLQTEISIKKTGKLEAGSESYLKECFEKWYTQNASLEFVDLRHELGPKIMTLELLLFNIDEVIGMLFKHLEQGTSLSVYTVLDMIQSLVCDIREDIMPYLSRVFGIISKLVEPLKNDADSADLVICAFRCIGHIIFYLNNVMIRNGRVSELLPLVKPLLFHPKKPFIRKFMAQCLAFLVRGVKDFFTFFDTVILDSQFVDDCSSNHSDAIGKLMSSCLKTNDSILASAPRLFHAYFDILFAHSAKDDVVFIIACFDEMFKDLLANIDESGYRKVWLLMLEKISLAEGGQPQELELLTLELFFKSAQQKKLSSCSSIILQKVKSLVCDCASDKVIEIVKILIAKLPPNQEMIDLMRAIIMCKGLSMPKKFEFVKEYLSSDLFEMTIKNSVNAYLSSYVTREWINESADHISVVLHCLYDLVITKYPINQRSTWKDTLINNHINENLIHLYDDDSNVLIDTMLTIIRSGDNKELLWITVIILPHIYPINVDARFIVALRQILDTLEHKQLAPDTMIEISAIMECMSILSDIQQTSINIPIINTDTILAMLQQNDYSSLLEPILLGILSNSVLTSQHNTLYQSLFLNKLMSPSHQSRLASLDILMSLSDEPVLAHCHQLEQILEVKETDIFKREKSICRIMDYLRYNADMSDLAKQIVVSHLIGALHVNYTSLWKYIIKTLTTFYPTNKDTKKSNKTICDSNENVIWTVISSQLEYCALQVAREDSSDVCLSAVYCCPEQEKYIQDKFYTGRAVDWLTYRLNVIKTLVEFPELAGKKTAVLSPLMLSVYCDEVRIGHKANMKTRKDTLMNLLFLYSRIPNITCTHSESKCRQLYYKCLSSKRPELQKAAFDVLMNYKMPEMLAYNDKVLQLLAKGQDNLKEMSLSEVIPSHRRVMIPQMMRIIIGKLKNCGIVRKQKPLINWFHNLEDSEIETLLLVVMEALKQTEYDYETINDERDSIESIIGGVKEVVMNGTQSPGLLKTMLGVCSTIHSLLVALVNKMSNTVLTSILMVVLDMYDCCTIINNERRDNAMETDDNEDEDDNEKGSNVIVKQLRQKCATIVLYFFTKIVDQYQWTDTTLNRITLSIVQPQLERLVIENVTSANTTIQLSVLWSNHDQLIHLITPKLFSSFVTLLTKSKLNRETVGTKLVNIVYNIMMRLATDDRCKAMVSTNIGSLITYLGKRVTAMRPYGRSGKHKQEDQQIQSKELSMVTMSIELLLQTQWTDNHLTIIKEMINNVLTLLYKSNPFILFITATEEDNQDTNKEAVEVSFLRALESMMFVCATDDAMLQYFERLLTLFGRLRRRASRSVLSSVIAKILTTLQAPDYNGIDLGTTVVRLNSWDLSRLEDMDYDAIMDSLDKVCQTLQQHSVLECVSLPRLYANTNLHPSLWLYHATAQNCLYLMAQVTEMGPREKAADFLRHYITSLAATGDEKLIKVMFFDHMWPFIANALSSKEQMCHLAFLSLINTVLIALGHSTRFTDIQRLAHKELEESGFFDGMLSLADSDQTKALNKLSKFLSRNQVAEHNLREIIRPMIYFRVESMVEQTKTDKQRSQIKILKNEYNNACKCALTAMAKQCPAIMYKKMVEEQMWKIDKGVDIETAIAVLISILNGYNGSEKEEDNYMVQVLHRLETYLSRKDPKAEKHKNAKKGVSSNEDLLRKRDAEWTVRGVCLQVPIAKAMINIAVKMPKKHMKAQVTRVILKLVGFLKSNDATVRKTSIDTLIDIILRLNETQVNGEVKFLNFVVSSIKSQLSRGFQRHVGLFACHSMVQRLIEKNLFEKLCLESPTMSLLIDMYLDEQFGEMAKEKTERHDAEKGMVREAVTDKAYVGLSAVSQIVAKSDLLEFVRRITDAAKQMRSEKSLNKMRTILDSLKGGLLKNNRLDAASLFTVSMVHINDNVDALVNTARITSSCKSSYSNPSNNVIVGGNHFYEKPVRLDEYTASGYGAKLDMTHNYSFLIVNFGLSLFNILVKSNKTNPNPSVDLRAILEPVVDRVIDILTHVTHKDIMVTAIKCLSHIIHVAPPRLDARVKDLTDLLFNLHQKNAFFRDKTDLSSLTFYKTMTNFLQRSDVSLNHNQYKLLLLGIELNSFKKRMNSIYLLKTIISRRIKEPPIGGRNIMLAEEIDVHVVDVVARLRPISLDGDGSEHTRQEARTTILSYIRLYRKQDMEYIRDTLVFYIEHIVNAPEEAQLSAAHMMQAIMADYGAVLAANEAIKMRMVGFIIMAMRRGVTDKVEMAFSSVVTRLMVSLDSETQCKICDPLMTNMELSEATDIDLGILTLLMGTMTRSMKEHRVARIKKYIDILCSKMSLLIDESGKLYDQIRALCGEDGELMSDIAQEGESVKTKEEIIADRQVVIGNVEKVLVSVGDLLDIDHSHEEAVDVKRHLISQGLDNQMWSRIITRLLSSVYTSNIRTRAAKGVIEALLRYETEYEEGKRVFERENVFQLIEATFAQLSNNDALSIEECDTVLLNVIYTWRLILANYEGEVCTLLLTKVLDHANRVAISELEGKTTLMRRCTVLKLLAAVVSKTSVDDMTMAMKKNIVWIWSREHRQLKNDKNMKADGIHEKVVTEWTELVNSVGTLLEQSFASAFKDLNSMVSTERAQNKRKRIIDAAALAVSHPGKKRFKK